MTPAPLIVMLRPVGADRWRVQVSEEGRVTLSEIEISHSIGEERVALIVRGGRVDAGGNAVRREEVLPETWDVEMGAPIVIRKPGGSIEVVCFRADDTTESAPLSAGVLQAIEGVRGADTPAARNVLSDVLEESGAFKEAAYVRLEQELQARPSDFSEALVRFRALGRAVGTTFRYLVGRDVAGCAGLRWTFRCPRKWEEMTVTPDAAVRACGECRQLVSQAESEDQARQLAERGICVSLRVDEGVDDWEGEISSDPELDALEEDAALEVEPPPEEEG